VDPLAWYGWRNGISEKPAHLKIFQRCDTLGFGILANTIVVTPDRAGDDDLRMVDVCSDCADVGDNPNGHKSSTGCQQAVEQVIQGARQQTDVTRLGCTYKGRNGPLRRLLSRPIQANGRSRGAETEHIYQTGDDSDIANRGGHDRGRMVNDGKRTRPRQTLDVRRVNRRRKSELLYTDCAILVDVDGVCRMLGGYGRLDHAAKPSKDISGHLS
jgi:hypothetical protein